MLSETLEEGLKQYEIGSKVRRLRANKKMGLVQLGEHTGLSAAMLSKIERGQLFPTLPTLLRIALVFGVGLDHFFAVENGSPTIAVTRRKDRLRLPDSPGSAQPSYFFESLDFPATDRKLEAFLAEFPVRAPRSRPHSHEGAELIYVIEGKLAVAVEGEEVELGEGDSMYFEADAPHGYEGRGARPARAIIVTVSDRPSSQ